MSEIASVVLPFFGLIGCGFFAVRIGRLTSESVSGLNLFCFNFALPAWLFVVIVETQQSELPGWSFVITTMFGTYCAFALAFSLGALLNRGNVSIATIQGLIGSYGNIGFLAPALTVGALGLSAAAPVALVLVFDTVLLLLVAPGMMLLGGVGPTGSMTRFRAVIRQILFHPFVIAVVAGLLVRFAGQILGDSLNFAEPVFEVLEGFLSLLRWAAPGVALFAMGASAAVFRVSGMDLTTPAVLLIKLIVHPLIAYLLLTWIGGFKPVWIGAAVLAAALPPAANVLGIARLYSTYVGETARALFYGLVLSIITITGVLIFLPVGG